MSIGDMETFAKAQYEMSAEDVVNEFPQSGERFRGRDAIAAMECLPPSLAERKYYRPTERGFEKEIKRRMDGWQKIKADRRKE